MKAVAIVGLQIALLLHLRFQLLDALLVDKHHQVAGIGEIDLRGEQRGGNNAVVLLGGEISERDREQRAADTVTDGVDLLLAGRFLDRVERRQHAFAHILFEAFLGELRPD